MDNSVARINLQSLAAALGGEVSGQQVLAPSPGHSAADRGMSIKIAADAPDGFLVKLFNEGDAIAAKDYVRAKLGLPTWQPNGKGSGHHLSPGKEIAMAMASLRKPAGQPAASEKIVATYDYKDARGVLLYQKIRYEPKRFVQRAADGAKSLNGIERVLYRLSELTDDSAATVFICEGEKDCDRVRTLDLCATSADSGTWKPDLVEPLRDRDVILVPHFDYKGTKRATEALNALHGVAKTIRMLFLPGLDGAEGNDDASDWLNQDPARANIFAETCLAAPLWVPGAEVEGMAAAAEVRKAKKDDGRAAQAQAGATALACPNEEIRTVSFLTLLEEEVIEEPDYIEPNFAGPGQFILIAGPPKAQKSLLLQEMLVSCAIGVPFLLNTFTVARPLRVFWLQAEMNRKLLRKRAREFDDLTPAERELVGRNLVISERFRMLLSEDGVKRVVEIIRKDFPDQPPDIIGFDPLANLFDGDNENDNSQLLRFLMVRLEAIRQAINSAAIIVLVHHSAKRSAEELARDPFAAIRGAGALRGYYDSAIVIFRPSEDSKARKVHFELRGGEAPEPMTVVFSAGRFRNASEIATIDKTMARKMLADLKAAWDAGKPWSHTKRAKSEGRNAAYNLSKAYNVKIGEVTALVTEWARLNIITIRERVTRKHPAGFEVTGTLD
jgi:hypothetical protein